MNSAWPRRQPLDPDRPVGVNNGSRTCFFHSAKVLFGGSNSIHALHARPDAACEPHECAAGAVPPTDAPHAAAHVRRGVRRIPGPWPATPQLRLPLPHVLVLCRAAADNDGQHRVPRSNSLDAIGCVWLRCSLAVDKRKKKTMDHLRQDATYRDTKRSRDRRDQGKTGRKRRSSPPPPPRRLGNSKSIGNPHCNPELTNRFARQHMVDAEVRGKGSDSPLWALRVRMRKKQKAYESRFRRRNNGPTPTPALYGLQAAAVRHGD